MQDDDKPIVAPGILSVEELAELARKEREEKGMGKDKNDEKRESRDRLVEERGILRNVMLTWTVKEYLTHYKKQK